MPLYEIARGIKRARASDPLTPVTVREAASEADGQLPRRARERVPGRRRSGRSYLRHYPYHDRSPRSCSATSARSRADAARHARIGRVSGRRRDRPEPASSRPTTATSAASPATPRLHVDSLGQPHRLRAARPLPKPGHTRPAHARRGLQQAAEKALAYGISSRRNERPVGRERRRDRRARPEGRLDPCDRVVADLRAVASSRAASSAKALASQGLHDEDGRAKNYPSLNRVGRWATYPPGSVVQAGDRARRDAGAPRLAVLVPAVHRARTPRRTTRPPSQVFKNWDPFVNQQMDLPTALAYSCDTYFYQLGDRVLRRCRRPRPAAAEMGERSSASAVDHGRRRRAGGDRGSSRRSAGERTYTRKTDPRAGRSTSLWKPGDSIQLAIGQKDLLVTPLQMARFYALHRERRQARDAARADGRREPERDGRADRRAARAAERSASTPPRSRSSGRASGRGRTSLRHVVRRLRQLPGLDRGQDRHGGEGRRRCPATPASRTSRGGAATARPTTRRSSSAP